MQVNKILLRYSGLLIAVVLSCRGLQAESPASNPDERQEIGFVSKMRGPWTDQQGKDQQGKPRGLRIGDRIYADSQLQHDREQWVDDLIEVTFHGVNNPVSYVCKDGLQCREPIEPGRRWKQLQPTMQRDYVGMLRAVASLFTKGKPTWVATISPPRRGRGGNRSLGLARLEGETVDVADLLASYGGRAQLPAPLNQHESLAVEFCPVLDEGVVQCPEVPTTLHELPWADRAPQQVRTPGMQPGLYLMMVCYPSGTGYTLRSPVRTLVLVTPAQRFAMVDKEWQRMQEAVRMGTADDASRTYELLVAGLVSLRRTWLP